ncbi:MAG: hypothetical protein ACI9SG_000509 [Maribacter sp.]
MKIVALGRKKGKYKQSPTGEEWGLQILRIPAFILYKNGREVNRIPKHHARRRPTKNTKNRGVYSP